MRVTAFSIAQRFIGIREIADAGRNHPFIVWCFECCGFGLETSDEIPWCAAFANRVAWLLRLPRSKSARARSWLAVGQPVALDEATPGWDVVVVKQAAADPGPEVPVFRGHVGFFAGLEGDSVLILGGNQGDSVSIARFPVANVLGVRRLREEN